MDQPEPSRTNTIIDVAYLQSLVAIVTPESLPHLLNLLLKKLKSPNSPQEQRQVIRFLRFNPQIKEAFINHRKLEHIKENVASLKMETESSAETRSEIDPMHEISQLMTRLEVSELEDDQMSPMVTSTTSLEFLEAAELLDHTAHCGITNCKPACNQLRTIICHARLCKIPKSSQSCTICNQLRLLCDHHAKDCKREFCFVTHCDHNKTFN